MRLGVRPDVLRAPVRQRADLAKRLAGRERERLDGLEHRAGRGLVAAKSGEPGIVVLERAGTAAALCACRSRP